MGTNFKDYLGSKDVKWWDGVLRTFSRRTSTGGTLSQNKIGQTVDVVEAYGNGTDYSAVSINMALSSVGSNLCVFTFQPGSWAVDVDVMIPANVTLLIPHGAKITIGTGVTLTINGPIIAGAYEIFSGTGTLSGTPLLQYWDPTWKNATVTDSTTKSYKALVLGAITVASVVITGAISAASAVFTGAISAASVVITGAITASTVTADTITAPTRIVADVMSENTPGAGILVDGCLIKDGVASLAVGTVSMFAGATAPTGYLMCDGSAISRTTYANLYAVIGITYGAGDTLTTFNIPNFKGRSPIGVGQGNTAEGGLLGTNRTLASIGGAEGHVLTIAEMPAHTHTYENVTTGASGSAGTGGTNITSSTGSQGGDTSHENMTPFLAVNFIIKY